MFGGYFMEGMITGVIVCSIFNGAGLTIWGFKKILNRSFS